MPELNPIVCNLTNLELINMCEANGNTVAPFVVRELCNRIESLGGQVRMFNSLADANSASNKKLLVELKNYQETLNEIMGDN